MVIWQKQPLSRNSINLVYTLHYIVAILFLIPFPSIIFHKPNVRSNKLFSVSFFKKERKLKHYLKSKLYRAHMICFAEQLQMKQ